MFGALALLGVALGGWYARRGGQPTPANNLILISIDTLRADHLGIYGYDRDTSPHLDRFARASILFKRAIAQAPSTRPSHMSLFTSLYQSTFNPSLTEEPRLPDWPVTLAELLKAHGFATWGFVDGGNMRRIFGFDQGFDHYADLQVDDPRYQNVILRLGIKGILQQVERWLDTHPVSRFFLFVHCYDVHTPYVKPPPYDRMFGDPEYRGNFEPIAEKFIEVNAGRLRMTPEDLRDVIARYDGGIRYTDEHLGGFFKRLAQRGLLDSTVVVVTADHGEEFLDHGKMMHTQLYFDSGLHVPLLFFVPGETARTVEDSVELIDVLPTVLELLGLPPDPAAMGRSLVPFIRGRRPAPDGERVAYAEPSRLANPLRTVVSDRYQLLQDTRSGGQQLFDLAADPRLTTNVAAREPGAAARLLAALEQHRQRIEAVRPRDLPAPAATISLDEATRAELRALGYVED